MAVCFFYCSSFLVLNKITGLRCLFAFEYVILRKVRSAFKRFEVLFFSTKIWSSTCLCAFFRSYFSSITNKSNTGISIEALLIDVIVLASEVESRGWGVWGLKIFMHDLFFNYTFLFLFLLAFMSFFIWKIRVCLVTDFWNSFLVFITEKQENPFDNHKLFFILKNRKYDIFIYAFLIV